MLTSGPELISHTTVQHVDDPIFIDHPELARAPAPLLTDDLNEVLGALDSDDHSLPFLGGPKPQFFGKMTPPSISMIGVVAFKQLINVGEEYTINIQPTSNYLEIEAL